MSKLFYPNDGIYKYCRTDIESCSNNLNDAYNNCNLDVPSNFAYKNYLNSLDSVIRGYCNEINSINSKLERTNSNYDDLESELSINAKNMETVKIKDRERMII